MPIPAFVPDPHRLVEACRLYDARLAEARRTRTCDALWAECAAILGCSKSVAWRFLRAGEAAPDRPRTPFGQHGRTAEAVARLQAGDRIADIARDLGLSRARIYQIRQTMQEHADAT